ncbi:hypothetical protein ACMFMG_009971 [Clarireedia jacksonii]
MAIKQDEDSLESQDPLLSEKFDEAKDKEPPQRMFRSTGHLLAFGVMTILFFTLFLLSVFAAARRTPQAVSKLEPPDHTFCGHTPEDAIKNGCHFESMLSSWVPDACYFDGAEQGYDVFSDLPWFADPFLKQPLTDLEMMHVRAGNYSHVYTTWSYHDEHCLYTWRKLAMAMERRLPYIDTKTANEEHSLHCAMRTRNYVREDGQEIIADLQTVGLKVTLTYFGCVSLF